MLRRREARSRRTFLKTSALVAISARLGPILGNEGTASDRSRIVRIHNPRATEPWDYSANAPWDHTVEPRPEHNQPEKISERYFDYIDEGVVAGMLDFGLRELTDTRSAADAWRSLMPGLSTGDRITVKMNMNNTSFDPDITTNRMNQTMPLVNAVLDDLVTGLGIPEEQITLLDASRWLHPVIMVKRCKFPGVRWVDSAVEDRWDRNEYVTFTKDDPAPGGHFWMPKAYTQSDHIVNLCLMKNHDCGITGAMKNHFGSIPTPGSLHEGLGDKSYIADLCNTPSIRDKVRVNIADALFANWHNNVWAPRPWRTFPEESPNSLLLGTDPVALDSVMLDHIISEIGEQGDNASQWVRDCVANHDFLEYTMDGHGLGVHEHRPYGRIDYREIEG